MFVRLRDGGRSVREIADGMHVSRSAVSQHLKVLKDAGLVAARAEGARRIYAVDAAGIAGLRNWLDGFWDEALGTLRESRRARNSQKQEVAMKELRAGFHPNSVRKAISVLAPQDVAWRVFTSPPRVAWVVIRKTSVSLLVKGDSEIAQATLLLS